MSTVVSSVLKNRIDITTYNCDFSKHTRVSKIAKPSLFSTQRASDLKFKKYYSKKVIKLDWVINPPPSFPLKRYKALRTLQLGLTNPIRLLPKSGSINNFRISDIISGKTNKTISAVIKKTAAQYKRLTSLEISKFQHELRTFSFSHFKLIRTLNRLQLLSLVLTERELLKGSKYILAMKSLKTFKVTVSWSNAIDNPQAIALLEVYSRLIQSNSIENLKLDLLRAKYRSIFTNNILQNLKKTQLASLDIYLAIIEDDPVNNRDLDEALLHIDLLNFSCQSDKTILFSCSTKRSNNLPLREAKRKLNLELLMGQDECEPTKTEIAGPLKDIRRLSSHMLESFIPITLELHNVEGLKNLLLDLKYLKKLELQVKPKKMLASSLKSANTLEYLRLSEMIIANELERDKCEEICQEISKLPSLKTLEIVNITLDSKNMGLVNNLLCSLVNLNKLAISFKFVGLSPEEMDFSISFPEQSKLTELDIKLPKLNLQSKINFIKSISQLQDVQKLTIQDGTQILDQGSSQTMLMEVLLSLNNLKEIDISGSPPAEQLSVSEPTEKKKIATELRDLAINLFNKKRALEFIHLFGAGMYEINYKKY